MPAADPTFLLGAHRRMAAIRAFEEVAAEAHAAGQLPGLLHLSIGGEAVAVGVTANLGAPDRIYSSHRAHGHFLAAGTDPVALMSELAGRETGLCRGRGGSMHLMAEQAVLATGVVGGTLPIAIGHALTLPADAVAVVFFGDGAAQTGVFHEAVNLASLWRARVLFVCENNGWAEFSARAEHTRVESVAEYARLQQMPTLTVDGRNVGAVYEAAGELLLPTRAGDGPALLECHVTRVRPHYEGDLRRGETDRDGDPLAHLGPRLTALGIDAAALDQARADALSAARDALGQALAAPLPRADADVDLVFARAVA